MLFREIGIGSSGVGAIVLALSISYWVGMARIVRGDVLQLKQQEFILAARTLGASKKGYYLGTLSQTVLDL